jgi:hypothetical protein
VLQRRDDRLPDLLIVGSEAAGTAHQPGCGGGETGLASRRRQHADVGRPPLTTPAILSSW